MFFEQIMNFRSNKHFLVHFGVVRVAGGEKEQQLCRIRSKSVTNRFIKHPTGSSCMGKVSQIPGDQPIGSSAPPTGSRLHQPVGNPSNRFIRKKEVHKTHPSGDHSTGSWNSPTGSKCHQPVGKPLQPVHQLKTSGLAKVRRPTNRFMDPPTGWLPRILEI